MSIMFHNGMPLIIGGAIAMDPACCCEPTVYPCPDSNAGDCTSCGSTIQVSLTGEAGKKSGRISGTYTLTRSGCGWRYTGTSASGHGYLDLEINCASLGSPAAAYRTYVISYLEYNYGQSYAGYILNTDPSHCPISYGSDLPPTYSPPDGTLALAVV